MKRTIFRAGLIVALSLGTPTWAFAQHVETGFLDRSVDVDGETWLYQIYVPRDYNADRDWPVTLFLHGAGERGSEGLAPTHVGLGRAIRFNPERWPSIVVFPQVPDGMSWQGAPGGAAMEALDATMREYSTDPTRVYLTGLSLGGNGTWVLGYTYPERFAALVPICGFVGGGGRFASFITDANEDPYTALAARLKNIPVWIFHGDADTVVPAEESRRMAAALEAVGAEVHYTEFPDTGHNAWDPAYGEDELPIWLFSKTIQ